MGKSGKSLGTYRLSPPLIILLFLHLFFFFFALGKIILLKKQID